MEPMWLLALHPRQILGDSLHISILIYLLTAIGLTPGGSSTVYIYTQTIQKTTQLTTLVGRLSGIRTQSGQTKINDELIAQKLWPNWEECNPCPFFASYALAFALHLRKKHGKTLCSGYELYSGNVAFEGSSDTDIWTHQIASVCT